MVITRKVARTEEERNSTERGKVNGARDAIDQRRVFRGYLPVMSR